VNRQLSAAAAAVLLAMAAPAAAESDAGVHQVLGQGPLTASDPRVAALDDAFVAAVRLALAEVAAPDALAGKDADVAREVIGRARRFVARYVVDSERDVDRRHEVRTTVYVDLAKLVAQLQALGISDAAVPRALVTGPATHGPRRATLLLRVRTPSGVEATYGARASTVLAATALGGEFSRRGWVQVPASAAGPAASELGDLPLDVDAARALAGDAKAALAVVMGAEVSAAARVRGVPGRAVRAQAWATVIDVAGARALSATATAVGAAVGVDTADTSARAIAAAGQRALADAAPLRAAEVAAPGSAATAGDGEVLVTLRGGAWSGARAVLAMLGKRKGVGGASIRRVGATDLVLVATTAEEPVALARAIGAVDGVRRAAADGAGGVAVELR
jgi:hypothetical protein